MRYYQTAAGSSVTPGNFSTSTSALVALIMLNASASNGFSVIGDLTMQSQAVRAYTTTMGL